MGKGTAHRSPHHAVLPGRTPASVLSGLLPLGFGEIEGLPHVAARDRTYRRGLALADVLAVLVVTGAVTVFPGHDWLRPPVLALLPLVILLAKLHGLYDRDELVVHKTTLDEAPRLLQLSLAITLVFWVGERFFVYGRLSHRQALGVMLLLLAAFIVLRWAARHAVARVLQPERALFIGDAWTYERLRQKIAHRCSRTTILAGRLELHAVTGRGPQRVEEATLREVIDEVEAHRLIVSASAVDEEATLELVRAAKLVGVRVSIVPRVLDVVGSSVVFDDLVGMTLLGVPRLRLSRSSCLIKRAFDLAGASVAFVFASPLLLVIAVAIKVDSRGPVLFSQVRIGRDGRRFRICKFRTMVADAERRKGTLRERNETDGLFKIAADPRVTRVGRVLRRSSLDELPQLYNVLRGQMSLVGPRPLVLDEDMTITGYDRQRLALTPGMTGPWQILRAQRVPLPEMVKMDYLYVATWSLWMDVKLLLRTVPHVVMRRGL